MSVIWKFTMQTQASGGGQMFQVPAGAIVRHCAAQSPSSIAVWVEVPDTSAPAEERWFRMFWTGFELPPDPMTYVGTVLFDDGAFVVHVYEGKR